jgi:hypothetical protein
VALSPLLGLRLTEALQRLEGRPAPRLIRTAPARPRRPLPEGDEHWRIVRVDADAWVIAPSIPLPEAP